LIRVSEILPAGQWSAALASDRVDIDFDRRFRRRIVLTTVGNAEILVDLPQAVRLREGDGLLLEGGHVVLVCAKSESLLEIHAHDNEAMVRIAWHLGNRHLPVQLVGDRLRIRTDHVIAEMVERLGGHVAAIEASFDPESGAYADGSGHHHGGDDGSGE
jgi:urease accessory protein